MSSSISPLLYILLITLVILAIPKSSKALNNLLLWFCCFFSFYFAHLCIIFSFSIMITFLSFFFALSVIIFPLYLFTYLLYLGSAVFFLSLHIFHWALPVLLAYSFSHHYQVSLSFIRLRISPVIHFFLCFSFFSLTSFVFNSSFLKVFYLEFLTCSKVLCLFLTTIVYVCKWN